MALGALIIAILAGAGGATVARLLAVEKGPAFLLDDLRQSLDGLFNGLITDRNPELVNKAMHSLVDLVSCPICQSVWWSGLCAVVFGVMAGAAWPWIIVSVVCAPSIAWAIGNTGGWTRS